MPRGERVEENIYRQTNGTYFWRLERQRDGKREAVSGLAPTIEEARVQRDQASIHHREHGVLSVGPGSLAELGGPNMTVRDAVNAYLDSGIVMAKPANRRRPYQRGLPQLSTIGRYRAAARRYIFPAIGDVKLLALTQLDVRHMIASMAERGINPTEQSMMRSLLARAYEACIPGAKAR